MNAVGTDAAGAAPLSDAVDPAEDIRDIRGPKALPSSWLLPALLGAAVLLILAALVIWRWRRGKRAAPALSLTEFTLQQLEAARPLMWPASAREFGIAASETVRTYIEKRFDVIAIQRTTEEFLQSVVQDSHDSLRTHRPLLEDFLQQCDFVKFAGGSLTTRDMESLLQSARKFVLETGQPQPP